MDIDLSDSDMSRLTTMLTEAGAPFERSYGAGGVRIIEMGNVSFEFGEYGDLVHVTIAKDLTSERTIS